MSSTTDQSVAIVVSNHDTDLDKETNDDLDELKTHGDCLHADTEDESRSASRGSMTIFLLGKTYQWCSRARVAAWFRSAFSIREDLCVESRASSPDTRDTTASTPPSPSNENNINNNENKSPKKLYELKPLTQTQRKLTLEPQYAQMFPRERSAMVSFESDVPRMMRTASGCWKEEFTSQLHSKMIEDAVRVVIRSNSDSGIVNVLDDDNEQN